MKNLDEQLAALAANVPPPRRTDAAFARSVADGVNAKKSRTVFMFPLAAATAAALAVFALVHPATTSSTHDAGTTGVVVAVNDAARVHPTTTVTDTGAPAILDDEDSPFALPSLEGSSDEELAFLDRALDQRLHTRNQ